MGDELTVAFALTASEQPLQLRAIVRHHTDTGTGVEFLNLSLSDRLRIVSFIDKLSKSAAALPA